MASKDFSKRDLVKLIEEITGYPVTPQMLKQINRFILVEDMSYLEIARCISWYVDTKNGTIDPLYGIWFVPNVRIQAAEYFHQLELEQKKKVKEAQKIVEYQENNIIFNIKSLEHKKRQPKHLNIDEINVKGEDKSDD